MDKLDKNDLILVNDLKNRIDDVNANADPRYKEDRFLMRWLRAKNMNVDKAEQMVRQSLNWRESNNIDKLGKNYEPSEVLSNYMTGGWFGHAKDGCMVYYQPYGNLDFAGMYRSVPKKDVINHFFAVWEKQQLETNYDQYLCVIDFDGFGMKQLTSPFRKYMQAAVQLRETIYPETLKCIYVVNPPKIWNIFFALMKPFLSEDTKKKIVLLGENSKPKFLEVINANQLPKYYGGDACDPDGDPSCKSKICWGGIVPESYYLNQREFSDTSKLINLTIKHGDILKLEYEVSNHDRTLNYYFKTQSHKIKFGISFQSSDSDEEIFILPIELYNSHIIPESGFICCPMLGKYIVHFDTSYTWKNSKELSYFIEIGQTGQNDS